jgi:hypothetical protein
MIGPSAETLIVMGAKDTALIIEEKEGWRLLSSAVLHAGLVHFLINMLALWFVGAAIETTHGWFAAMVIFCISAVGGTILSAIFLPEYITVGASGGIFGFIGACCADIVINWRLLFCDFVTENGKKHRHILVVVVLLLDIILNSIIGLTPVSCTLPSLIMCPLSLTCFRYPLLTLSSSLSPSMSTTLRISVVWRTAFCVVFLRLNDYPVISLAWKRDGSPRSSTFSFASLDSLYPLSVSLLH